MEHAGSPRATLLTNYGVMPVHTSRGRLMLARQGATQIPKPSPDTFWHNLVKGHKNCDIKS